MKRVKRRLAEGFAYSVAAPDWIRGPAVIDGDDVVLEERQRERYQPHTHADEMLFELAAVTEPHDVLRFVRRYGLLWHGPDASDHRESLDDWRHAVAWLRHTLVLATDLAALLNGDGAPYGDLRENELVRLWADLTKTDVPILRGELERFAAAALAHAVTAGLGENVKMRVVADVESVEGADDPAAFRYFHEPQDLLGHVFAALSHLIVQRGPIARCPECGRSFPVEHGRQQFCTPACASRARYKRFAAKRRKREETT